MKKALITGITGQDGYYLASYLLNKEYEVHGTVRRSSLINTHRIDPLISKYTKKGQLKLHYSDLIDSSSLSNLVNEIMPDEVYNLGAQSHVAVSFKNTVFTTQVGNLGTVSLLEAIRTSNKNIKFYQCYGTADLGLIAYEADIDDGMILDEDIILEIVKPGTNDRVPDGEVGEVVVTVLNNYELPIVRFATGDLSTIIEGQSKTGRTNKRIKGWLGRADQTTKVRGMFVQPSQIAKIIDHLFDDKPKAKLIVSRENNRDILTLQIEHLVNTNEKENLNKKVVDEMKKILNLNGEVEFVNLGTIPNDGKVIDDIRDFGD